MNVHSFLTKIYPKYNQFCVNIVSSISLSSASVCCDCEDDVISLSEIPVFRYTDFSGDRSIDGLRCIFGQMLLHLF